MDQITLNNFSQIPVIGYGTFPQKQSLAENVPIAISLGYRMVDSSDNYINEGYVGEGLMKCAGEEIVVVSKFSQPLRSHELEKCFLESKKKLGGHLNVYLLHWPYPFLWRKLWRKMEDLYFQGKCDAIGVCNFDKGYLRQLLKICRVKPAINQFERHPLFPQHQLKKLCEQNGIQVMSYSPLARHDEVLFGSSVLKQLAEKYNKTIGQIILRWDVDTGCIPIPASASECHMKENIDVFSFSLEQDEIDTINSMDSGRRIRFDPRRRFTLRQKLSFLRESMKL